MIETERLLLRPPLEADIEPWGAMLADPVAMRFLGGARTHPRRWLTIALLAGWSTQGTSMFSVIETSTGRWIGRVGPRAEMSGLGTEIGWMLTPDAWGRGYATEAATASIDWAIATLGWTDIRHVIHAGNHASMAVAGRLGADDLGHATHQATPVQVWGQTADQWRRRAKALPSTR